MNDNGWWGSVPAGSVPWGSVPGGSVPWGVPDDPGDVVVDVFEVPVPPVWWEQAPEPDHPWSECAWVGEVPVGGAPVLRREVWQLSDAELLAEAGFALRGVSVAQARWLVVLAEVERRQVTWQERSVPTSSWLAAGTTHSARAARHDVRVAVGLGRTPQVAAALADGGLSREQAEAILAGVERLPEELDAVERDAVVGRLVEWGAEFGPTELRRLVNRAVEVVAPQVAEDADRQALERAERSQARGRNVSWRRCQDGSVAFSGQLPAVAGELLINQLTAIGKALRKADALAGVEPVSRTQANADALVIVLAHHARCDATTVGSGDWARVVVTLNHQQLLDEVGAAGLLGSGERVTAGEVRRLACGAGIIPLVMGGRSQPLDVGRTQRLFTPAQKLALALRDAGCAFPGCDRPPGGVSDAHHINAWATGGNTDLPNGVLLCPHHHHLIEPNPNGPPDQQWRIDFDVRGKPRFTSPARTGGVRITHQHARYRL